MNVGCPDGANPAPPAAGLTGTGPGPPAAGLAGTDSAAAHEAISKIRHSRRYALFTNTTLPCNVIAFSIPLRDAKYNLTVRK